jgi:hypothetical protein
LRWVASAKDQARGGKKQHNAYQSSENRSRRLQVTADVCGETENSANGQNNLYEK